MDREEVRSVNRNLVSGLPDSYRRVPDAELVESIRARKAELGTRLVVLGHHYQRREIVGLADFRGDSFGLSRTASQQSQAEFIAFCGVEFMAQSADILRREGQAVLHPDTTAGCPMADMAGLAQVSRAWEEMEEVLGAGEVIPVTYMNSHAELKAFTGRHGGSVCTSSNAGAVVDWVRGQGRRIFFFPDEHLGRNTGLKKGIPRERMLLWDSALPLGGNEPDALRKADLILWKGYCHVHTHFRPEQVREVRERHPGGKVVVHPECVEEVVRLSDAAGSTGFIIDYVKRAPAGSTIAIGTEINLVSRLAHEHPDKKILPLSRSLCPNMWRVSLNDLAWTLDELGRVNLVEVDPAIKADARSALNRMLELT